MAGITAAVAPAAQRRRRRPRRKLTPPVGWSWAAGGRVRQIAQRPWHRRRNRNKEQYRCRTRHGGVCDILQRTAGDGLLTAPAPADYGWSWQGAAIAGVSSFSTISLILLRFPLYVQANGFQDSRRYSYITSPHIYYVLCFSCRMLLLSMPQFKTQVAHHTI